MKTLRAKKDAQSNQREGSHLTKNETRARTGRGQLRGDGFPRQRDAINRFAKANRYRVVDEFRDEGVSGTRELDERPGLAALLDRVENNHVRVVLVENASRLARDLMVQEVVLAQFRKAGVRVIAADAGTDLTVADGDPTRKLFRQVLGAFAEFEKSIVVLKLRARVSGFVGAPDTVKGRSLTAAIAVKRCCSPGCNSFGGSR